MKVFTSIFVVFATIAIIILGNLHWNDKITSANIPNDQQEVDEEASIASNLTLYTTNWPQESQDLFAEKLKTNETFTILLAGSQVSSSESDWTNTVIDRVKETYGDSINIATKTYDSTSTDFVADHNQEELIASNPDLIILEPFILNDNLNRISLNQSLENIKTILEDVKKSNPQTTFVLQPSFPIYKPVFYLDQIEALKDFAKEQNITYLDHWTAWPDYNSTDLNDYLMTRKIASPPNEKGFEIWSKYIADFLISQP